MVVNTFHNCFTLNINTNALIQYTIHSDHYNYKKLSCDKYMKNIAPDDSRVLNCAISPLVSCLYITLHERMLLIHLLF